MIQSVQLELTETRVISEDDIPIPGWVIPVVSRMRQLESLPPGWDSYGGVPLQRKHRDAALRFLGLVMTDDIELPDVVPLADGGVQLEWRREDLDVDFISDDEVVVPTLYVASASESRELAMAEAVEYFSGSMQAVLRNVEAGTA